MLKQKTLALVAMLALFGVACGEPVIFHTMKPDGLCIEGEEGTFFGDPIPGICPWGDAYRVCINEDNVHVALTPRAAQRLLCFAPGRYETVRPYR